MTALPQPISGLFAALQRARTGIAFLCSEGTVLECNPSFAELLGLSHVGARGADLPRLLSRHAIELRRALTRTNSDEESMQSLLLRPGGSQGPALALTLSGGDRILAELVDVSDLHRESASNEFLRLVLRDGLTGLPNRLLAEEAFRKSQLRAARSGHRVGVLFLDLDGFKSVNDRFGHAAGDAVLIEVARRLEARVRPGDTVARIGGDEFLVVCDDMPDRRALARVADDLAGVVRTPFVVDGGQVLIGVSIGSRLAQADESVDVAMQAADVAMYRAKQGGGGFEETTTSSMVAVAEARTGERPYGDLLGRALEAGRMEAWAQVIVDVEGQPVAVEALARLRTVSGHIRPPAAFLPRAHAGEVQQLDRWMIHEASRRAATLPPGILRHVSANVCTETLRQPDFTRFVVDTLSVTGLRPESLVLEIVEPGTATLSTQASTTIAALQSLGVGLAVDDLGASVGAFGALGLIRADWVKLDRSLVAAVGLGDRLGALALGLARTLRQAGYSVVAEGIEDEHQFRLLREAGCDLFQGFLFGAPIRAWDDELVSCRS